MQDSFLVVRIEVHVDVAVRSGLSADQGVDAPPSFEPEPAACRAHGVEDRQDLGRGHALLLHDAIIEQGGPGCASSAGENKLGEVRFER